MIDRKLKKALRLAEEGRKMWAMRMAEMWCSTAAKAEEAGCSELVDNAMEKALAFEQEARIDK